jgi:tetratricopeptide (TPR) repeat protein
VDGRSVADDRLASLPTAPRIDRPNAPRHNRSIRKLTLVLLPAWLFAQSGIHDDDARHLLYSARYADAAIAYRELLTAHPDWGDGYDALTRALLGAKRTPEAYRVAEEAMQNAPDSAGAQAAVGRIRFRQGDLAAADGACHKAARLDTHSAVALHCLAQLCSASSFSKRGAYLYASAHRLAPGDPRFTQDWANTLDDKAQHIAALEQALAVYSAGSEEAEALRAQIAADKALGERRIRILSPPYAGHSIPLIGMYYDAGRKYLRGFGLHVRFNDGASYDLLLDTGAGGITLNRRAAEKAKLERLEDNGEPLKGIGDTMHTRSFRCLAQSVQIGDLKFTNFPVDVSDSKRLADEDGLIGSDIFEQFLVTLDFPKHALVLEPFAGLETVPERCSADAEQAPAGFINFYRFGHMILLAVSVNGKPYKLFALDSGAPDNLIDTDAARESTKVHRDSDSRVGGINGRVQDVYRASKADLTFAGLRHSNSNLTSFDMHPLSDDVGTEVSGIIGMSILRQLRVTIDYRNGAIRLVYPH